MTRTGPDYAAINGWDSDHPRFEDVDRPSYLGSTSFGKRPLIEDPMEALSAMALRRSRGEPVRFEPPT